MAHLLTISGASYCSAADGVVDEATRCLDADVDAGIVSIGAAQARGNDATEFVVVDGTATRVAAAGILAPRVGTEGGTWHTHFAGIHALALILADQLKLHSAQLCRGITVAVLCDAPAGDAHVVAGTPLYAAQWNGVDVAARHGTVQAQHSNVHVHFLRRVRTRYAVACHTSRHARLSEFGDAALHSEATR